MLDRGDVVTRDDVVELADGPTRHDDRPVPAARRGRAVIAGMAAIATDITEWTRVEAALAERQRLLETVVRASPDIVTILDGNGRVREISEASARILGYDLDDPVHEELEALVHPDDLARVHAEYGRSSRARDTQLDLRYRVRHADGHWVMLDSRGQAIVGDDGRPWGPWWCRATSPTSSSSKPRCTSPSRWPSRPAGPRASSCRG